MSAMVGFTCPTRTSTLARWRVRVSDQHIEGSNHLPRRAHLKHGDIIPSSRYFSCPPNHAFTHLGPTRCPPLGVDGVGSVANLQRAIIPKGTQN